MANGRSTTTFDRRTDFEGASPTLVEGLPGHGLVASIVAEQLIDQLELDVYGRIRSEAFPPVTTFENGRVRDPVRVYAGTDPDVLALHSGLPIPGDAYRPVSRCVLEELADEFDRAIFVAGTAAESDAETGEVTGIATTADLADELDAAGVELADGFGTVGGVTGALMKECFHADVPAVALMVTANPFMPDPSSARTVIETALEPLTDFGIDASALSGKEEQIRQHKRQIAEQLRQSQEEDDQSNNFRPMYQ